MSRFYITELRGDLTMRHGSPNKPVGVSFHILDRLANYRCVATFRTEDYNGTRINAARREKLARQRAHEHLTLVNAS